MDRQGFKMIYGVSGASGSGKTTLCKLVSDSLDIPFVKTSITEGAKRHGYDAVGNLPLGDRFDLQKKLLMDHVELLGSLSGPVILDRTPIDMIGYMLGEITMSSYNDLSDRDMTGIAEYVGKCQYVARERYDFIFHLRPLEFYEQATTRPANNPAYQRHTDLLMRGAMADCSGLSACVINTTDLTERQNLMHDIIVQRLDGLQKLRQSHPKVH